MAAYHDLGSARRFEGPYEDDSDHRLPSDGVTSDTSYESSTDEENVIYTECLPRRELPPQRPGLLRFTPVDVEERYQAAHARFCLKYIDHALCIILFLQAVGRSYGRLHDIRAVPILLLSICLAYLVWKADAFYLVWREQIIAAGRIIHTLALLLMFDKLFQPSAMADWKSFLWTVILTNKWHTLALSVFGWWLRFQMSFPVQVFILAFYLCSNKEACSALVSHDTGDRFAVIAGVWNQHVVTPGGPLTSWLYLQDSRDCCLTISVGLQATLGFVLPMILAYKIEHRHRHEFARRENVPEDYNAAVDLGPMAMFAAFPFIVFSAWPNMELLLRYA